VEVCATVAHVSGRHEAGRRSLAAGWPTAAVEAELDANDAASDLIRRAVECVVEYRKSIVERLRLGAG